MVGDHHVFSSIIRNTVKLGEAPLAGRPITQLRRRIRGRANLSRASPGGDRSWPGLTSAPPPRDDCRRTASFRRRSSACCPPRPPIRRRASSWCPIDRIEPNPEQPRLAFDEATLEELAASIREHGVLQPILLRPIDDGRFQLIAGERRWRASKIAGSPTIPALVEDIDDDTALEISIIENLQREDISPLDEAAMYDRMIREHGYSIRRLAEKLGKDKGYLENRLRLADAPPEVRELVSLRKDTLSHAYELMKVEDPKKRRRLADQVARNELSLVKLREKIEGRPARTRRRRPRSPAGAGVQAAGRPRTPTAGTIGSGSGSPSPTTAWSPPSSSSTRPSRSCWASSGARTSSTPSARPTGPTSPST